MTCFSPVHLDDRTVPCGKCLACQKRRQSDWTTRLEWEYKRSHSCYFVTLTYDEENVPNELVTPPRNLLSTEPPAPAQRINVLRKRDVQLYMKRLRKAILPNKIRFFCCGEYGPKTYRPHYHILIFNIPHDYIHCLHDCWDNGFTTVSNVTPSRIAYVAKYSACYTYLPKIYHTKGVRPFCLCSNGIGSNYMSPDMVDYHRDTLSTFIVKDSIKRALPKYYRDRIFDDQMKMDIRFRNEKFIANETQTYLKKYGPLDSKNRLGPTVYQQKQEDSVRRFKKLLKNKPL